MSSFLCMGPLRTERARTQGQQGAFSVIPVPNYGKQAASLERQPDASRMMGLRLCNECSMDSREHQFRAVSAWNRTGPSSDARFVMT